MKIRKLKPEEHKRTRLLYEEVFSEDSRAFVDYYYRICAEENRIYVWETQEKEIVSMLHLNPYPMRLGAGKGRIFYIVAVATGEAYRGRGLMRGLLMRALQDMYEEKLAFTFLMPAAEAIYTPFDFRFIYSQRQFTLFGTGEQRKAFRSSDRPGSGPGLALADTISCRRAKKEDLKALSEFGEGRLKQYATAAFRTEAYFEKLLEEQECQNGEIMTLWDKRELKGSFFTAREPAPEIREAVASPGYEEILLEAMKEWAAGEETGICGASWKLPEAEAGKEKQAPVIMGRLVNARTLASCLRAEDKKELYICLEDSLLAENTGSYLLIIDREGGRLEPVKRAPAGAWTLTPGRLIQLVFGYKSPEELKAPEDFCREWKSVRHLGPVFLNEVV